MNATSLLVEAHTSLSAIYQADAPPESIYDGKDFPSSAVIHVGVTNVTHATIVAGARVTVTGTGPDSLAVNALDDTTVDVLLNDTATPTSIIALATSILDFLTFDRLTASTTLSRDTKAEVDGPVATGFDTLSTAGSASVSAENSGGVATEVDSDFIGTASNTATKDDAIARSSGRGSRRTSCRSSRVPPRPTPRPPRTSQRRHRRRKATIDPRTSTTSEAAAPPWTRRTTRR